jgi:hypothetical protein
VHLIVQRATQPDHAISDRGGDRRATTAAAIVIVDLLGIHPSPAGQGEASGLNPSQFIYEASCSVLQPCRGFISIQYTRFNLSPHRRLKRLIRLYLLAMPPAHWLFGFAFIFTSFRIDASTFGITIFLVLLAVVISVVGFFPLLPPALKASPAGTPPDHPELRANRLVSIYLFFTIILALLVPLIVLFGMRSGFQEKISGWPWGSRDGNDRHDTVVRQLNVSSTGASWASHFAHPALEFYSARITTSLEKPALVRLLRDELLPSLLVRQSVLFQIGEGQQLIPLYTTGVLEANLPVSAQLAKLLDRAAENPLVDFANEGPSPFSWIRMILPLSVQGSLVGLWLLGRRDPDDLYQEPEIEVLHSIANQTAIALINIQQSERLHALYQADIERQEAERAELAYSCTTLLNQLAALNLQRDSQDID